MVLGIGYWTIGIAKGQYYWILDALFGIVIVLTLQNMTVNDKKTNKLPHHYQYYCF